MQLSLVTVVFQARAHSDRPSAAVRAQKATSEAPHTVFDISACSPHTSPAHGASLPARVGTCGRVQSQKDASCGADPDLHTLREAHALCSGTVFCLPLCVLLAGL